MLSVTSLLLLQDLTASEDFANPAWRILTVQCVLNNSCEMNKYAFMKLIHQQKTSLRLLPTLQGTKYSEILPQNLSLQKYSCTHSLQQFFKYFQAFEPLRLCAPSATTIFQQFRSGCNSETSLNLRTPCMVPVLNLHFCKNENNVIPPELAEMNFDFCQRTPCRQFHCTPCRKALA
jgi:hypothetical protein